MVYGPAGGVRARGATVEIVPAAEPIQVGGVAYNGHIVLRPEFGGVIAIEDTGIDDYVRGVVAREMPSTWAPPALEAQAVAARTYALATRKPAGHFDVYSDVRSQVYGGVQAQTAATDLAVETTAGQILTYEGQPIVAYFHSTSGGRTANVEDVFFNGTPEPYLVAVDDPADKISPYYRWKPQKFTRLALGRAVQLGGEVRTIQQTLTPSGRVKKVTFKGRRGRSVSYTGAGAARQARAALLLVPLRHPQARPRCAGAGDASAPRRARGQGAAARRPGGPARRGAAGRQGAAGRGRRCARPPSDGRALRAGRPAAGDAPVAPGAGGHRGLPAGRAGRPRRRVAARARGRGRRRHRRRQPGARRPRPAGPAQELRAGPRRSARACTARWSPA